MYLLIRWAAGAVALYLTVLIGQQYHIGLSLSKNPANAFVAVIALALVNALIRPIVKLVTLPITCLTLGLFNLVINAGMFYLVGQLPVGLRVPNLIAGLFGSVVFSVVSGLLNLFIAPTKNLAHKPRKRRRD